MPNRKLYRPSWAAYFSLILHIVWIVVFAYIIWVKPSFDPYYFGFSNEVLTYCSPCQTAADSIRVASEMGRLDVIGLGLTVLGVVLAVAAFSSFFFIRSAAMYAAREEAGERIGADMQRMITPNMIAEALRNNPQIMLSAVNQAQKLRRAEADEISQEDADQIAGSFDGDER